MRKRPYIYVLNYHLYPSFLKRGVIIFATNNTRKFALTHSHPGDEEKGGKEVSRPSVNADDEFRSPGASCRVAQHPAAAAADGYIPHHLDRFIARHRHDGSSRGSQRKGERERESARART